MNKRHRKLMRDLAETRPILPPDLENWGDSASAKRVLDEIVSSRTPETARSERKSRPSLRLAYVSVALVVVLAAAVLLGIHFLGGAEPKKVVSQPTTTTSVAAGAEIVTVQQALEEIVALAKATPGVNKGQSPGSPGQPTSLSSQAVAFGLISSTENPDLQLEGPVTRKQFALWVWRCFGLVLPRGSVVATVSDLGALTVEERQAVEDLIRDGVVEIGSDGAFRGDDRMTAAEGSILLGRVKVLVR